ncbi:MAG: hypothetical protein ABSC94_29380 [Polyangiaceae bacterium]
MPTAFPGIFAWRQPRLSIPERLEKGGDHPWHLTRVGVSDVGEHVEDGAVSVALVGSPEPLPQLAPRSRDRANLSPQHMPSRWTPL